jgi:heme exporter protein D
MNWGGPAEFLAMGGYAPYVWGSYALSALLLLVEPALAARRLRKALRQAAQADDAREPS